MPEIYIETVIAAPREVVFDLTRSIDFHQRTTHGTQERAVGGRTSGLIEMGESVTWEARHLGVRQRLSSIITEMARPHTFTDEMTRGAFKRLIHRHDFLWHDSGQTVMVDRFSFEAPLGLLGHLANRLFLRRYMHNFLLQRAQVIKQVAESDQADSFLNSHQQAVTP